MRKQLVPSDGIWIATKFSAHCRTCHANVAIGNKVLWHRGQVGVLCYQCGTSYRGDIVIPQAAKATSAPSGAVVSNVIAWQQKTLVDSLTGLELAQVMGSVTTFTGVARAIASKHMGDFYTHRWEKLQNIGVARGCHVCLSHAQFDDSDADHFMAYDHLTSMFSMDKNQIISLFMETQDELTIEVDGWVPKSDGSDQGAPLGWRGFTLTYTDETSYTPSDWLALGTRPTMQSYRKLTLTGAKSVTWDSNTMRGECLNNLRWDNDRRQACLDHIENGGYTQAPKVVVQSNRHGLVLTDQGQGSKCLCGIYGYHSPEGLSKLGPEFNVITQMLGYGTVAFADDGFKASDAKIIRGWLVKSHFKSDELPSSNSWTVTRGVFSPWIKVEVSIDWPSIVANLSSTYRIPFSVVDDWSEIYGQLELEKQMNTGGWLA